MFAVTLTVAIGIAAALQVLAGCNDFPLREPVSGEQCAAAGERLRMLQCKSSDGTPLWQTPEGTSFADACERAAKDGRNWHPECLATIEDCGELEAAYRGKQCR